MSETAKFIIIIGLLLVTVGIMVLFFEKLGIRLGSLPGDIKLKHGNFRLYLPIATSILLSIVLTVLLNLILRARR